MQYQRCTSLKGSVEKTCCTKFTLSYSVQLMENSYFLHLKKFCTILHTNKNIKTNYLKDKRQQGSLMGHNIYSFRHGSTCYKVSVLSLWTRGGRRVRPSACRNYFWKQNNSCPPQMHGKRNVHSLYFGVVSLFAVVFSKM